MDIYGARQGAHALGELVDRTVSRVRYPNEVPHAAPRQAAGTHEREIVTITCDELAGRPIPVRRKHVPGLIPARTVTLLGGDGGTGKSLLALQLAVASAVGRSWIGLQAVPGPVLYLSAEDDLDELHRRLAAIVSAYGLTLADLAKLKLVPLAGEDAVLAAPNGRSNVIAATPLWRRLDREVTTWRPVLVILDTLADLFAGEENQRAQARQFIGLLRGMAIQRDTTIVLLGHPSQSGITSGSGSSGSTGWSNSVRSRLYLKRAMIRDEYTRTEIEPDPDIRVLATMKANYGRTGGEIRVRWQDGTFQPDAAAVEAFEHASKAVQADMTFLDLLASYQAQGRPVSSTPSANYAPSVFAKDPRSNGLGKTTLQLAMNRLFSAGRIVMDSYGPPSKSRRCIVVAPWREPSD